MSGVRLDQEMVRRRLLPTRSGARRAIVEGQVRVGGTTVTRPAHRVDATTSIELQPAAALWVSRGGEKLAAALAGFSLEVHGRRAADLGASTGGFTDVLLDAGVASVLALDVGHDQLHPRLQTDSRVAVCERLNVRDADPEALGAPFGVVVADLSFISLTVVAADIAGFGDEMTDWLVLVKPQFEVGRGLLSKDGVVRSATARSNALIGVARAFAAVGLGVQGALRSPIAGGSGNREAFVWLRRATSRVSAGDLFKVLQDE
jgi:23S rRNA (cytidine1920-2'-O)/16S rRNA (cytidine1409-2'-O)-methyltransferase